MEDLVSGFGIDNLSYAGLGGNFLLESSGPYICLDKLEMFGIFLFKDSQGAPPQKVATEFRLYCSARIV